MEIMNHCIRYNISNRSRHDKWLASEYFSCWLNLYPRPKKWAVKSWDMRKDSPTTEQRKPLEWQPFKLLLTTCYLLLLNTATIHFLFFSLQVSPDLFLRILFFAFSRYIQYAPYHHGTE